jgi:hypothetical protein
VSENKKDSSSARQYLTTHCWKKVLEEINWEGLQLIHHNTDLAPSNFNFYGWLEVSTRNQKFEHN